MKFLLYVFLFSLLLLFALLPLFYQSDYQSIYPFVYWSASQPASQPVGRFQSITILVSTLIQSLGKGRNLGGKHFPVSIIIGS